MPNTIVVQRSQMAAHSESALSRYRYEIFVQQLQWDLPTQDVEERDQFDRDDTVYVIRTKEAAIESSVWIGIGLAFGLVILALYGGQASGEYYAGYLIEKSLSIDNVFVWALIFSYFAVPRCGGDVTTIAGVSARALRIRSMVMPRISTSCTSSTPTRVLMVSRIDLRKASRSIDSFLVKSICGLA